MKLFKHQKQMTNFERIKAMSIEDMARIMLCPAEYDLNFNINCGCAGEMNRNCYECCKKWLESEADNE